MQAIRCYIFRKIPWRREWLPTLVFLLGEFHGQRSLGGATVHEVAELDTPEGLTLSHFCFHVRYFRHTNALVGDRGTMCQRLAVHRAGDFPAWGTSWEGSTVNCH